MLRLRSEIEEGDFCDEAARDGLTGRRHSSYEICATPHIITVNRPKAFLEAGQDESVEQGVLKADVYRWRRAAKRRKYRRSKNPNRETTGIQPQKWKWSRRTKWSESWLAERTEDESWNARTRRSIQVRDEATRNQTQAASRTSRQTSHPNGTNSEWRNQRTR